MSPRRCSRLALKRERSPSPVPPPLHKDKKKKLSNADRVKAHRDRVKNEQPERYKRYLEENASKCKAYRAKLSDERKAEEREKSRLRVQKSRLKKKEELAGSSRVTTRNDIAAKEIQRAVWRGQKQKQAEQMSSQKKRRVNERRRLKYKDKKDAEQTKNSKSVQCEPDGNHLEQRTPDAQRKALHRAKAALPKSPRRYVWTVKALIQKASPRKQRLFKHTEPVQTAEHKVGRLFIESVHRLRHKNFAADRVARRVLLNVCHGSGTYLKRSSLLGISRKTLKRHENIRPKEKKTKQVEEQASVFYEQTATPLPDKKLVSKKTGKAAAILRKPLHELHKEFCSTSGQKISFSTFAKCRPSNVKLMAQAKLRQCLCEYCTNVDLKLTVINAVAATCNYNSRIRHERHAVTLTTCDGNKKNCCYRSCDKCGVHLMNNHLRPLLQHNDELSWHRWESRMVASNGKQVTRKVLVTKKGSIRELVDELMVEVAFLSEHLFRADWQHKQFLALKNISPFPANTVCMVMDFAENFACTYQQEVQAAHWHHEQVTVHPTVTYYKCSVCEETVTESLVFISADRTHDYHAVHAFTERAVHHLREKRGLSIEHICQWTDGCASQYKSKGPFSDISCSLNDFSCTMERNFFGSRHGKGPSDGESAVVKHHATSAIITAQAIIASAKDLFEYCQQSSLNKQPPANGCSHFLRTFFWVDQINRSRNHRAVSTVKGTRTFHSVRCVKDNEIVTRHLSCLCLLQCGTRSGECVNTGICGPCTTHVLRTTRQKAVKVCVPPQSEESTADADDISALDMGEIPARKVNDVPALDVNNAPDLDVNDALVLDVNAAPALDVDDAPVLDVNAAPALDVDDAPVLDVNNAPDLVVNNASVLDVNDAPDLVVNDAPVLDVNDAPALDVNDVPVLDVNDAPVLDVNAAPDLDVNAALPLDLNDAMDLDVNDAPDLDVSTRKLTKGAWITVTYGNGKRQKEYVGKSLDVDSDGDDIHVQFLRCRGNYFTWPNVDDIAWVNLSQVKKVLGHPMISIRDQYIFE